ncbi:chemokine (C-C motif) ligand 34b, duplicate 4 [Cyclopterus lumpus]|uniref:chemokine (C-C motif) ligand 34b, duplicate 4 n=1 Tax=Cyclopterus lumpus TaxID=8103 RepID=UPI0014867F61|nr:chemokine (C-C motif) ligand 34b, duplicate 4 [Cyclopterus lumpus]
MSRGVVTFALLLSLALCFRPSAANRRFPYRKLLCCTKVSSSNMTSKVIGHTYRKQPLTSRCPEALIFATQAGTVCVDPAAEWAQRLAARMTRL